VNPDDLRKLQQKYPISPATIARNSGLGGLQPEIRQPQTRPLEPASERIEKIATRVVKCRAYLRITIIRFCARPFDDGNIGGSYKQLQDVIAAWIGCDDSRRNIEWEYSQVLTHGKQGTAVKIERL
jgi:hypothetical protein